MAITTVQRRSFCLTKEAQSQLKYLVENMGENSNQVFIRAIMLLYTVKKKEKDQKLFDTRV